MSVKIKNPIIATVEAEHRDGQGNLIARSVSIQAPAPPNCMKPKCLFRFFIKVIECSLLSTYHRKRVEYAEKKRHDNIPMKYRTGEDSPETIRELIWGIVKLKLRR